MDMKFAIAVIYFAFAFLVWKSLYSRQFWHSVFCFVAHCEQRLLRFVHQHWQSRSKIIP